MNCRRTCGLLSAYLDAELTLSEMDLIGSHLKECPHCRGEYQSLLDTKRLLASLAHRTSRSEIESLLRSGEDPWLIEPAAGGFFRGALRPKPLAATALLSLAGLWIASASLDTPKDGVAPGSAGLSSPMTASVMPGFGIGMRSLRYLNEMVHSGPAVTAVIVPVNADGLILSPESPYPATVSGNDPQYRHRVSLSNVLSSTTSSRDQASLGNISVYTGSGASNYSRAYSVSTQRFR